MKVDLDFHKICTQGALVSTHTPLNIQEYLEICPPPETSAYHLVGCSPEMLPVLLKLDSLRIIKKYLPFSAMKRQHRQKIIDVCLPYRDPFDNIYLGRYILFRGCLVAIRLCTSATLPGVLVWPRCKVKRTSIPFLNGPSVILGQLTLNLKNVRIAFLFSSELPLLACEYLSYNFDLVSMVANCSISKGDDSLRKQLEASLILVQTEYHNYSALLGRQELKQLVDGVLPQQPINRMYLDYYAFDQVFSSKYLQKQQRELLLQIKAIEIDLYFGQGQPKTLPLYCHPSCFLTSKSNPHLMASPYLQPQLTKYLSRLCSLLWHCYPNRPLVLLNSSASTLAFLFILQQLAQQVGGKLNKLSSLFHFGSFRNKDVELLLKRIELFGSNHIEEWKEDQGLNSFQGIVLNAIDRLSKNQINQWFAIIGEREELKNVVQMVNQRPPQSADGYPSLLQTWLHSSFFSESQLYKIYQNPEFINFINCPEYLQAITLSHKSKVTFPHQDPLSEIINLQLSEVQIQLELSVRDLSKLVKCNNPLLYGFARWVKQRGLEQGERGNLISHYLFRRYPSLSYNATIKECRNLLQMIMLVPKPQLPSYFQLLSLPDSATALRHHISISKLEYLKTVQNQGSECSNCQLKYPSNLLFMCQQQTCKKNYCYTCLFKDYQYTEDKLIQRQGKNERAGKLGKCPHCRQTQIQKKSSYLPNCEIKEGEKDSTDSGPNKLSEKCSQSLPFTEKEDQSVCPNQLKIPSERNPEVRKQQNRQTPTLTSAKEQDEETTLRSRRLTRRSLVGEGVVGGERI